MVAAGDVDFTLTDTQLTFGDDAYTLSNIDEAVLTGGASANTLDASGFTGTAVLDGGAGDDTLIGGAGDDTLRGGAGDDTLIASAGTDTLDGGTGNDTLIAQDTANAWRLTALNAGTLNSHSFVDVENLSGGADYDTFVFVGGSVSGVIDGGGGSNTFDYSANTLGVTVDLTAGSATDTGGASNIQNVTGGAGGDTLTAGIGSGTLTGGAGDDMLIAANSAYTFEGGAGTDTLVAAALANTWELTGLDLGFLNAQTFSSTENLKGGAGDDIFVFLDGSVSGEVDGGDGINTLDYAASITAVAVNLRMGSATSTGGVRNIRNVRGSAGDDILKGNSAANVLSGGPGDDTLTGDAGDDTLVGGSGTDTYIGGAGIDTLVAHQSETSWNITGPNAGTLNDQTFSDIENLVGAADNEDTFVFDFDSDAALSGLLEGGAGGFDSLIIEGGSFATVTYNATGPDSGSITYDGTPIAFTGLEPITDNSDTVDRIITASASDDVIRLKNAPAMGQMTLESDNGTFESITFLNPSSSLTIDAGAGDDVIIIESLDPAFSPILGPVPPQLNIEPGIGSDTIVMERDADFVITDATLTAGADVILFSSPVERAVITGNSLDTTGYSGSAVFIQGIPDWVSQGPGPLTNAQVAGIPNQPVTGAINAIATHPSNASIMYVSTVGGGIWKTSDAGNTWEALTDQFPSLSITAIAIDPADPDIIYAGTGNLTNSTLGGPALGQGLLKSENGGRTWEIIRKSFFQNRTIFDIVPTAGVLLVATQATTFGAMPNQLGGGLLRSTNGGRTFFKISGNANDTLDNDNDGMTDEADENTGLPGGTVTDLVVDPSNASRIYAAMPGQGVFRSENAGLTWTAINGGITGIAPSVTIKLAVSATADAMSGQHPVYAAVVGQVQPTTLAVAAAAGVNNVQVPLTTLIEGGVRDRVRISNAASSENFTVTSTAVVGGNLRLNLNAALANAYAVGDNVSPLFVQHRLSGVFRTPDHGMTAWTPMDLPRTNEAFGVMGIHPGGQGRINISLAADPGNANLVYIGGDRQVGNFPLPPAAPTPNAAGATNFTARLFRGDASQAPGVGAVGIQWHPLTDNFASGTAPHADSRAMVFDSAGNLLEADDGGIYLLPTPGVLGEDRLTGAAAAGSNTVQVAAGTSFSIGDGITLYDGTNSETHTITATAPAGGNVTLTLSGNLANAYAAGDEIIQNSAPWRSANGDLSLTELYSVAYDSPQDLIVGGAQDVGTGLQSATGASLWNGLIQADGAVVQTDASTRYFSIQNFGFFSMQASLVSAAAAGASSVQVPAGTPFRAGDTVTISDNTNTEVFMITGTPAAGGNTQLNLNGNLANAYAAGDTATVRPPLTVATTGLSLRAFDRPTTVQFVQPYVLNSVNPSSILIGTGRPIRVGGVTVNTGHLYESADNGRTLNALNGMPVPTAAGGVAPNPAANVGIVSSLVYGGREPDGMGGFTNRASIGYVGTSGDPAGNTLFIRQPGGAANAPFVAVTSFTNGAVQDVAADPDDWRRVWVLAGGQVWFSQTSLAPTDPMDPNNPAKWTWTQLGELSTLNGTSNLRSIAVETAGGTDVVLVGGEGGVFRRVGMGNWAEYGEGFPNTLVTDLDRIRVADDVVLAGSLGRGAWTIPNASQTLAESPTLTLEGSSADNVFYLERNADEPWMLDVFQYLVTESKPAKPSVSVPLASLDAIVINGDDGNDRFFIDASNGAVAVPGGITIDGGGGANQLQILESAMSTVTGNPGIKPGPVANSGSHTLTLKDPLGDSGTQKVSWTQVGSAMQAIAVAQNVDGLGAGLEAAAMAFQSGVVDSLRDKSFAGLDAMSLAAALNGVRTEEVRDKEDPLVTISQVSADGPVQIDNATSILKRLFEEGLGAFNLSEIASDGVISDPAALEMALEALDTDPNNVTLDDTTDIDGDGTPDIVFDVQVIGKQLDGIADIEVDAEILGGIGEVELRGSLEFAADVDLDFTFGIDSSGFFLDASAAGMPALTVRNLVVDGEVAGTGRLGFLGVEVDSATLALDPDVEIAISLTDPGSDAADGKIRVSELAPESFADLFSAELVGDAADGLDDDVVLTGNFGVGVIVPGFDADIDLVDAELAIAWPDFEQPGQVQISASAAAGDALLDFLEITSDDVLDRLIELKEQLDVFDADIPFLEKGLDQLVDLITAFQTQVLDPISDPVSGEANVPTLQQLAAQLAANLGISLDDLGLSYDGASKELTYSVSFSESVSASDRIDFGVDLEEGLADLDFSTLASITGEVEVGLDFGIDLGDLIGGADPADWFFIRNASATGSIVAEAEMIEASARFGFLSVGIQNGNASLDPTITLSLNDPGTNALDGRIDLAELLAGGTDSLLSTDITGSALFELPLIAPFIGLTTATPASTVTISLTDIDDFDTLSVTAPGLEDIKNFLNMDAAAFVSLLAGVSSRLDALRNSDFMRSLDIPFVTGAVNEVLDFAEVLSDGV
ncbi:MAG: hypothetical protein V3T72_13190, partial [Thermoanaerobaculia bacterium]